MKNSVVFTLLLSGLASGLLVNCGPDQQDDSSTRALILSEKTPNKFIKTTAVYGPTEGESSKENQNNFVGIQAEVCNPKPNSDTFDCHVMFAGETLQISSILEYIEHRSEILLQDKGETQNRILDSRAAQVGAGLGALYSFASITYAYQTVVYGFVKAPMAKVASRSGLGFAVLSVLFAVPKGVQKLKQFQINKKLEFNQKTKEFVEKNLPQQDSQQSFKDLEALIELLEASFEFQNR